jgi:hypothetical protein
MTVTNEIDAMEEETKTIHRRRAPCGRQVRGGLQRPVAGREKRVCQPSTGSVSLVRGFFIAGRVNYKLVCEEPDVVQGARALVSSLSIAVLSLRKALQPY